MLMILCPQVATFFEKKSVGSRLVCNTSIMQYCKFGLNCRIVRWRANAPRLKTQIDWLTVWAGGRWRCQPAQKNRMSKAFDTRGAFAKNYHFPVMLVLVIAADCSHCMQSFLLPHTG